MSEEAPSYVGPHEGREFDLMIAGQKHLSMFVFEGSEKYTDYPDPRFDEFVANGRFVKAEKIEKYTLSNGRELSTRYVLYADAQEAWRIPAMLMVQSLYLTLLPGRRPDLERVIGELLGYDRADVEQFITWLRQP
ncbi:hypothetical protein [Tardiphaga sp. OK245]|uniref:hypothetical protein n=1 Tax=Tardiphaga sp. OK245 TaxID=1855306 RepID=UPI0008A74785|nr:hypothetical protein [Tardiphaga sp. OK245]SEI00496.1 hypothetical protein SAMN05216367_2861 [Tardiphaga sp. OK245]